MIIEILLWSVIAYMGFGVMIGVVYEVFQHVNADDVPAYWIHVHIGNPIAEIMLCTLLWPSVIQEMFDVRRDVIRQTEEERERRRKARQELDDAGEFNIHDTF